MTRECIWSKPTVILSSDKKTSFWLVLESLIRTCLFSSVLLIHIPINAAGKRKPQCLALTSEAPAKDERRELFGWPQGAEVPCRDTCVSVPAASPCSNKCFLILYKDIQTLQAYFCILSIRGLFIMLQTCPWAIGSAETREAPTQFSWQLSRVSKPRIWGKRTDVSSSNLIREPRLWTECSEDSREDKDWGITAGTGAHGAELPFSTCLGLHEPL